MVNKRIKFALISALSLGVFFVFVQFLTQEEPSGTTITVSPIQKQEQIKNQVPVPSSVSPTESPVADQVDTIKMGQEASAIKDTYGNMSAWVTSDASKSTLILKKDGKEYILEQSLASGDEDDIARLSYSHPKFSSNGSYLSYQTVGYESGAMRIYNTQTLKKVDVSAQYPDFQYSSPLFFTADEKYLVGCSESGSQSGPGGWIFSVPTFTNVFDLNSYLDEYTSVNCVLENNTVVFELSQSTSSGDKKVIFSLDTKKAKASQ